MINENAPDSPTSPLEDLQRKQEFLDVLQPNSVLNPNEVEFLNTGVAIDHYLHPKNSPAFDTDSMDTVTDVTIADVSTPIPNTYIDERAQSVDTTNDIVDDAQQTSAVSEQPVVKISSNVTLSKPVNGGSVSSRWSSFSPISFLREDSDRFTAVTNGYANFQLGSSEAAKSWSESVVRGQYHQFSDNALMSCMKRKSDWYQTVEYEGSHYGIAKPSVHGVTGETKLTGQNAIAVLQDKLGIGSMITVPLWHTGIWITLKAPTDNDLLNLELMLGDEKVALGRDTNGLIYSNSSVYLYRTLVDFILSKHVYKTTLAEFNTTPMRLRDIISIHDIQTLAHAMACTIWPSGYPFSQPCITSPDKCMHITTELLNLSKMFWTDRSRLTTSQKKHMGARSAEKTLQEVMDYQEKFNNSDNATKSINDAVSVTLRVPSLSDYITTGDKWVENITEIVENTFTDALRNDQKTAYLHSHANLAALRQYGHWIKKITLDDGRTIEDPNDVDECLLVLSGDPVITNKVLDVVGEYIDDTAMSIVAIPNFKCPSCDTPLSNEETKHPYLVPQDAARIFFTLKTLKIMRGELTSL